MRNKIIKWFLQHSLTIASCVLITGLGIVFLVWSSPDTTTIGEDISTGDITASGNLEVGGDATTTGDLKVSGDLKAKTGRTATLIVAADDSSTTSKDQADYVCDGTNTTGGDQVEINTAINALPSTGGSVLLLEGTFWVDEPISVTSSVTLIGTGPGTVIKIKDTKNADLNVIVNSDITSGNDHILISNLKIDGNKDNNSSGNQYGIYFKKVGSGTGSSAKPGAKIEKLWVENFRNVGIYMSSVSNSTITGSTFLRNSWYGISLYSSPYNTIIGNTIQGSTYDGILFSQVNYSTVTGNIAEGNSRDGITLSSSSLYNTITGNIAQGNSQDGISLSGHYSTVTGNITEGNSRHGIYVNVGSYNIVNGNSVDFNGASDAYDGIRINNNSDFNLVSSNDITDGSGTGYAINVNSSDCDNNYLIGNRFSGTGASSINDSGAGTTIQHRDWFEVEGPIATAYATTSADYTITATDSVLGVDASSATTTITLPTASGITGRQYTIKKIDSSSYPAIADGNASETIDGSTTYSLPSQWKYVTVVSDGTNWLIVANN